MAPNTEMDRFKEFCAIVKSTEIPQNEFKSQYFYSEQAKMQNEIETVVKEAVRVSKYEGFKQRAFIEQANKLIRAYRVKEVGDQGSIDSQSVADTVRQMVRKNIIKWTGQLKKITVKPKYEEEEGAKPVHGKKEGIQAQIERKVVNYDEEVKYENAEIMARRRLNKSISEIGQLVDNISLHVGLQDEALMRLEDTTKRTEFWGIKTLEELQGAWDATSGNRKTILFFFLFWMLIFLLFWIVHR